MKYIFAIVFLIFSLQIYSVVDHVDNSKPDDEFNNRSEFLKLDRPTIDRTNKSIQTYLPSQISALIKNSLKDDSTLSVNAKNINVIVVNDEILLKGTAESQNERRLIIQKVLSIAPRYLIHDELRINSNF